MSELVFNGHLGIAGQARNDKKTFETASFINKNNYNMEQTMEEKPVAYTLKGKPLFEKDYIDSINENRRQIAEGKFVIHEEVVRRLYAKYGDY